VNSVLGDLGMTQFGRTRLGIMRLSGLRFACVALSLPVRGFLAGRRKFLLLVGVAK
jgi:hypothetical protein